MLLNCGVGEDSWESLGLPGDPTSPSKGNQSWIFLGRTYAEGETPVLWPPDTKNWLIGRDPDAGKDWRREEKGMTKDEMVGWHHWLKGHEFEQDLGVGGGQGGSLACCSPWGYKDLDTTEWLNWIELRVKAEFLKVFLSVWCQGLCSWNVLHFEEPQVHRLYLLSLLVPGERTKYSE